MPHSELAARELVAIPIYPELSEAQMNEVATTILEAVGG